MASAYTLAVRNNNGWEVLLAQKNVIDFRRTLQPNNGVLHICEHPGEYVIPGGEVRNGEKPGHAALRVFAQETQSQMPESAVLQQFYNIGEEAYFWLLWADENPWMILSEDEQLHKKNKFFNERDGVVSLDTTTGRLISSWSWEYYGESHKLMWVPISDAWKILDPNGPLSPWQEGQYALVQQAIPAYSNYNLIQVYHNRRIFSGRSERALRHLELNPLATNVQVYQDYERTQPVLLGGSGQITHVKGMKYLKAEKLKAVATPEPGREYFVVAYNGSDLVLMQMMTYTGKHDRWYSFSSELVFGDEGGQQPRPPGEPPPPPAPEDL